MRCHRRTCPQTMSVLVISLDSIFDYMFGFRYISVRPDGKHSGHIFMYSLVISDGYLVPVFTMLTEIHNANFIAFWIKEFLRLGGSIPNEFCVDMSKALLNASVCALTSFSSLTDYINALFGLNFHPQNSVPACFIRIDIAHLLKNVATSKHFINSKSKVRETYTRCVGLILKETEFQKIHDIIFSVLIMAYSSTEGSLSKQSIPINDLIQFLSYFRDFTTFWPSHPL